MDFANRGLKRSPLAVQSSQNNYLALRKQGCAGLRP